LLEAFGLIAAPAHDQVTHRPGSKTKLFTVQQRLPPRTERGAGGKANRPRRKRRSKNFVARIGDHLWLRVATGCSSEDAEDLTQGLVASEFGMTENAVKRASAVYSPKWIKGLNSALISAYRSAFNCFFVDAQFTLIW
jgi:hypothetical protein